MGGLVSKVVNHVVGDTPAIAEANGHLRRCIRKWGHLTVGDYIDGLGRAPGELVDLLVDRIVDGTDDSLATFYSQNHEAIILAYVREKHSCEFLQPYKLAYMAIGNVARTVRPELNVEDRWNNYFALKF